MKHLTTLALALALLAPIGASAATVLISDQSPQGVGNTADVYASGYAANTPTGTAWDVDPSVTNPPLSVNDDFKSPFASTSLAETQTYFAAGTKTAADGNGVTTSATLTYAAAQRGLALLWGSVDDYNTIEFFSGLTSLFTFTGADLAAQAGLATSPPNFGEVMLLAFIGFGPTGFDSVKFSSSNAAFEFGLSPVLDPQVIVSPVPVPAAGVLMLAALGGLVLARRRRA